MCEGGVCVGVRVCQCECGGCECGGCEGGGCGCEGVSVSCDNILRVC